MADTMPPAADRSEHPDYRVRKLSKNDWVVDRWTAQWGWVALRGRHRTKRMAVESTRPDSGFCREHWSWLCLHMKAAD